MYIFLYGTIVQEDQKKKITCGHVKVSVVVFLPRYSRHEAVTTL
uniref:Uncharacterized protein n=1 Tax=Anguilla anguilla TaxID=7936 RepID=A0A0E9T592_ANGAN